MILLIDIDGVLADYILSFTTLANLRYGIPAHKTIEHETWDHFPGLDQKQVKELLKEIEQSPSFWIHLQPLVDWSVFRRLKEIDNQHDLYFVTSRVGIQVKIQTEIWLSNQGIPHPTVLVSSAKGEIAGALGADALLEDKAGNALFTSYHSPNTAVYLISRPYNYFDQKVIGNKIRRVSSVTEFLDVVLKGHNQ